MNHFRLISGGLAVAPILAELAAADDLWNENRDRLVRPGSPHADSSDIWLRYFPRETLQSDDDFQTEGRCVFYPAWYRLPSLHRVVWALMPTLKATELGGILITRLPPGGRILPHADDSWHAQHFNRKIYLPLQTNPWCINTCGSEQISFRAGELWSFDNLVRHDVHNGGPEARIAVIMCFHSEEL